MNTLDTVAQVAAAYFSHNEVAPEQIPDVIRDIRESLQEGEGNVAGETRSFAPSDENYDDEYRGARMEDLRDERNDQRSDNRPVGGRTPARRLSPREIRDSIHHDYLISFEDGRQYKTLKRHLGTMGLTPETYKAKWGLPHDYPMTSRSFADQRSEVAKAIGLGRGGRGGQPVPPNQNRGRGRQQGAQPGNQNARGGGNRR